MCYQQLNRKVFNCFLNTSREMSGDRRMDGWMDGWVGGWLCGWMDE